MSNGLEIDEAKLRDRVEKLLRLADSSNAHEAAVAAGQAAALIQRYRLDTASWAEEAQEDAEIQLFRDVPLDASKRLRGWKIALGSVIAQANDCRIVVSGPRSGQRHGRADKERKMWLIGRPDDVERIYWMYPILLRSVEQLTRAKVHGASHRYREDFRRGVVTSLASAMRSAIADEWDRDARRRAQECGESNERALTLHPRNIHSRGERVEAWMQSRLGLDLGRERSVSVLMEAYAAGQDAGEAWSVELLDALQRGES